MIRIIVPPAGLVAAGTLIALGLKKVGATTVSGSAPLHGIGTLAPWVFGAFSAAAMLYIVDRAWRLWRFERGTGPSCRYCHGPLGPERRGRRDMLRRCLLCNRHTEAAIYDG
jgi:hypothetical protein